MGAKKKKKKKTKAQIREAKAATLSQVRIFSAILGTIVIAAAICTGFFYMERSVLKASPIARNTGPLEFAKGSTPEWFNEELASLMRETAGGKVFNLDKSAAKTVEGKLETLSWYSGLRVQTTNDSLRVTANYRKPIAWLKFGGKKYCIDGNLNAMRHLSIPSLPIVEIRGSTLRSIEYVGLQDDIDAAIKLIKLLAVMDKTLNEGISDESQHAPPLLNEIDRIDVDNFDGRRVPSKSNPHIIIYAKDGTPIYWGNELERTTGQLEATDRGKLAALYRFYTEGRRNTLLDRNVISVDIRKPR